MAISRKDATWTNTETSRASVPWLPGQGGCKFGDLRGRHTFRFGSESRLSWLCGVSPGAPAWAGCWGRGLARLSGHGGVSVRCQWRDEAEEQQREPVRIPVIGAELGGDVRDLVQVQDPGDGVADGGHGPVRAADAAGVLPEDDIADVTVHLTRPVAPQVSSQLCPASRALGHAFVAPHRAP